MLNRLSRSGPQTRNSIGSLDSDMSDFVQTIRMPSKRKVSSSPTKPGRSHHQSMKAAPMSPNPNDVPTIRGSDIFGANSSDELKILSSLPNIQDSSDDDDTELISLADRDSEIAFTNLQDPRPTTSNVDLLAGASEGATKRGVPAQLAAAMLVMPDQHSTTTDALVPSGTGSEHARYLPLCPARAGNGRAGVINSSLLTIPANHRDRIRRCEDVSTSSNTKWPLNEIPVELFDLITAHLARDDVKSMRLVNKEFEQKVSRSLFHTSVVPFNTELYDMIDEDKKILRPPVLNKGKRTVVLASHLPETEPGGLMWQNAKEDREGKVYKGHGLRVFQGFGPHIKRFGMTFEASEKQLMQPPIKKELEYIDSYHGAYNWPSAHYARFANLAGLENTADETSRMKAAFSNLGIVQELGLSIDSGLGWLNGPDRSLRSRVFERPSAVFGSKYDVTDRSTAAATEFWDALQRSQQSFAPYSNMQEITLEHRSLPSSTPYELDGIGSTAYANSQRWSSMDLDKTLPHARSESWLSGLGVLYATGKSLSSNDVDYTRYSIIPSSMRKEQKEWLLETQWAQQAFLESYMLAVIDNASIFQRVTTLKITKLSSRFLPMLARGVFWDALPCLSDVTIHVCADWRTVEKDNAGLASVRSQNPSEAVRIFHKDILRDRISTKESIKKLNIGWYGGGERAEGMFARNENLLPAPITQLDHCTANSAIFGLVFKSVEHLTLSNCWISPPNLEGLVRSHSSKALKKLTLDSVSITAHPRFPPNPQAAPPAQLVQAAIALQGQVGNNMHFGLQHQVLQAGQANMGGFAQHVAQLGPAFLQGANPQQLALLHQQWNQHMQNMQQLFNANPNVVNMAQIQPPHLNNPNAAVGAPAQPINAPQPTLPGPGWTHGHREGSWPQMIDLLSPGPIFDDYLPPPKPWEEPLPPRPDTNLRTIEFISCGYAKLPNHTGFDQLVVEPDIEHIHSLSPWFRARWNSLKPLMLESRDRYLGHIVQFMRQRELDALQFGWGLTTGWSDRSKAQEAEFDGLLRGGTGRFSGTIEHGMALVGQVESSSEP